MDNKIKRVCVGCAVELSQDSHTNRRYCSRECFFRQRSKTLSSSIAKDIKPTKCGFCGTEFLPKTRRTTKFCQYACYYKFLIAKSKRTYEKTKCEWCMVEFQPTRRWQKYCSISCRLEAIKSSYRLGISAADLSSVGRPKQPFHPVQRTDDTPPPQITPMKLAMGQAEPVAQKEDYTGYTMPICQTCGVNQCETPVDSNCAQCTEKLIQDEITKKMGPKS